MDSKLRVENLVKKFGDLTAVDNVSFAVAEGTCFGLLGPNGAGKTTTIEMIEDIIAPTKGAIYYENILRQSDFNEQIGIMFQTTALLDYLTVRETIQTFQRFYKQTLDIAHLISLCHLTDFQNQLNDKISGGQRQRLLLAIALLNDPQLIFLDEPSTGLDPQARHNLWDIIAHIKAEGKTIILTTHYMEEAQQLCDEIAIMDHGQIIATGSPQALIKKHCQAVTVVLPKANLAQTTLKIPFDHVETDQAFEFQTGDINEALTTLMAKGIDLSDLVVRSPNLEDVFLILTGHRIRD
jgi:ABC-2 type transport system ATP-binding protein